VTTDYLSSGTVIGEIGVLSDEPRIASVGCETAVQAFYISADNIRSIMNDYPVLEERLWRVCGIRTASRLLSNHPVYKEWRAGRLRLFCENGYIEVLHPYGQDTLELNPTIKEVIVVHRSVVCLPSGEIASAPGIVPQGTKIVALPTQKDGEPSCDGARLLVILREEAVKSKRQRQSEHNLLAIKKSIEAANLAKRRPSVPGQGYLTPIPQLIKSNKVHPEEIAEKGESSSDLQSKFCM
jgi:sodium/hydrogen exchanger 10/11